MPIAAPTGDETTPDIDEQPPEIQPNLAGNLALCTALITFLTETYWWPYEQLQRTTWDEDRRIDDAWRARVQTIDLNKTAVTRQTKDEQKPLRQDGRSARGQSVTPFEQIQAVTNAIETLLFDDGIPVRAQVPDDVEEDYFYQPTKQSALALNSLIMQNAEQVDFRNQYRKAIGSFSKYGRTWVHCPFTMSIQEVAQPAIQIQGGMPEVMQLVQMHQGMRPEMTPQGLVFHKPQLMVRTEFDVRHVHDVYCDPFISTLDMERQPCPFVREYVTPVEMQANAYDAATNPFGYLNTNLAADTVKGQYCLNAEDEIPWRNRLKNRFGLNDNYGTPQRERIQQRWTAYPMLRIDQQGNLDTGKGCPCPTCQGTRTVPAQAPQQTQDPSMPPQPAPAPDTCPGCQGSGMVHPPAERYIVQMFGGLRLQTTCLRIQKMPVNPKTGLPMMVPIIFGADIIEDDSSSIPMGKTAIMLIASEQATRAETIFENGSEYNWNRPWLVHEDSPAMKIQNLNEPGVKIPFAQDPKEAQRAEGTNYDNGPSTLNYIQRSDDKIQRIIGATDTILGQIASGRRSALEIGEATDAAKNPIVLMADRMNRQVGGRWAKHLQQNIEMFGDRDYIRRKTGRTYFGNCRIFTAVAQEFVKRMAQAQALLTVLQFSAMDPTVQPIRPQMYNIYFKLAGIPLQVPDQYPKAVMDATNIGVKILTQGIPDPPMPSDPHEIFVGVFEGMLSDPYWQQNAPPQNLEMLYQRMVMQQQMLQQQQQQQMMQQLAQQKAQAQATAPPEKPGRIAEDKGQQKQNDQGPQGSKSQA